VHYRRLGSSGPLVSTLGLGASQFGRVCDLEQTRRVVDAALEVGITFVDTAEAYAGSEELLGKVLKGRRHHVTLSSKFGHPWTNPEGHSGSRRVVYQSIEGTLRRLHTDFLDVYVIHVRDPETPIAETLDALHDLVQKGAIRYLGVSNFAAQEVVQVQEIADLHQLTPLLCVQNQYNLLERDIERDVVGVCKRYGLGIVPAVPLASGLLTGRYKRGEPPPPGSRLASRQSPVSDETYDRLDQLTRFATERGISLLQLAIGGLAAQPCVGPVITGATTPEQIKSNAAAAEWVPSADDLASLDALRLLEQGT
jgi:aryl-alcohol dehydrogenase-like predicted oxidoreductase